MADPKLVKIYRGYETSELLTIRSDLRTKFEKNPEFSGTTVGGNSFQRDNNNLENRLEAVQYVIDERTSGQQGGTGVVDYSGLTGLD